MKKFNRIYWILRLKFHEYIKKFVKTIIRSRGYTLLRFQPTALIRERCTNPDKQNVLKGDNQPDNDKKTYFTPNPTTGNSTLSCSWWLFDSNNLNNNNNNNNLLNNPKAAANVDIDSSGGKTSIARRQRESPVNQILWVVSIWTPPTPTPLFPVRMLSFKRLVCATLIILPRKRERENSW